jgi:predicted NBD/HSP70 family sugar kinase
MGESALRPSDRHVLATLRQYGALDRVELARRSGLPRSTVADVVSRLQREGHVLERAAAMAGAYPKMGRPPKVIDLAPAGLVGVVSLTHGTLQAAVTGFDGTIHGVRSVDAYAQDLGDGLVGPGVEMLDGALADAGVNRQALGCAVIGVPAPFRPGQRAIVPERAQLSSDVEPTRRGFTDLPPWLNNDPAVEFSALLGIPVWAENDANLGALGEFAFGAAAGMASMIYIKIVQGIGAGIVLDGRLHRGASGLAGELAHIHVQDDGPVCVCGGRGCLMTKFAAPRLVDLIQPVRSQPITITDVFSLAADGDPGVCRVLCDLGRTLGRSLADFCIYLNPDGIVVDGLLKTAAGPVIAGIREVVERYVQHDVAADVRVVAGLLGFQAEVLGAVTLARDRARVQ